MSAGQTASKVVWEHWPWALVPFAWIASGLLIWGYLEVAQFLAENSLFPLLGAAISSGLFATLIAIELDTSFDVVDAIVGRAPGGYLALSLALAAFLFVSALLRALPRFHWAWELALTIAAVGLVLLPAGYVAIRFLVRSTDWKEVFGSTGAVLADIWPPIALLVLLLLQIPMWRRWWWDRQDEFDTGAAQPLSRLILVGSATAALAAYVLLYFLPQVWVPATGLSNAQYADALTQERRTVLATLAAVGAGITLIYTHLRHQLDRDANATGRYTEAIQQLGDAAMSIRLGGIYALARVARDSPGDRVTISQVLAAFVRDNSRGMSTDVPLDVMAAITELGRRRISRGGPVDLRSCDLSAGNLTDTVFPHGVDLRFSNLVATNLTSANLYAANLSNATLSDSIFQGAEAAEMKMRGATADDANFQRAQLEFSDFSGADLRGADFGGAYCVGATFEGADVRGVNFRDADLSGADFAGVHLLNADLKGARIKHAVLFGTGLSVERARLLCEDADEAVFTEWALDDEGSAKDEAWARRERWLRRSSRSRRQQHYY